MAILTNAELCIAYDANLPFQSPRILALGDDPKEHAAQCIAVEVLRGLLASAITVQQYNDLSAEDWQAYIDEGISRASLNVAAPVNGLTAQQKDAGASYGGNFFETGYATVVDSVQQADRVQVTKIGGV